MQNYPNTDVKWNMSDEFLKMILDEIRKVNEDRATPDIFAWYRRLVSIHDNMYFEFDPDENKKVEELLNAAKEFLDDPNTKQGVLNLKNNLEEIEQKLSMSQRQILIYLNNHERIFSKSKFDSWQDELKEDFK